MDWAPSAKRLRGFHRQAASGDLRRRAGADILSHGQDIRDAAHDGLLWLQPRVRLRDVHQQSGRDGRREAAERLRDPSGPEHRGGQIRRQLPALRRRRPEEQIQGRGSGRAVGSRVGDSGCDSLHELLRPAAEPRVCVRGVHEPPRGGDGAALAGAGLRQAVGPGRHGGLGRAGAGHRR